MTAMSPLEQAVVAWARDRTQDELVRRQWQYDDARALAETGMFSNRNIALITGLDNETVGRLTGKPDKTGGRLNPASLEFIQDLSIQWRRFQSLDITTARCAIGLGTSCGMVAKLSGVPRSTLYSKIKETSL